MSKIKELEEQNLVAVYGTLKKWWGNHSVMERAEWVFQKEDYIPYESIVSGWFPMVKFKQDSLKFLKVELYKVPKVWVLKYLDALEGHPSFYVRKEVTTLLSWVNVTVYEIVDPIGDSSDKFKIDKPHEEFPEGDYFDWK